MQYYRSDFTDDTFSRRHPSITRMIWVTSFLAIMSVSAYFGGIEYVIADIIKNGW